jgi:hypothetical protein
MLPVYFLPGSKKIFQVVPLLRNKPLLLPSFHRKTVMVTGFRELKTIILG